MRKEIIFAVVLGVILGTIILYGSYIANKATSQSTITLDTQKVVETPPTITLTPTTTPLTITFPRDNYVSFTDQITITGTGPITSPIAIISENNEYIIDTDATGRFSTDITLVGGENDISLTTYNDNQIGTVKLTIIYTTADIK